MKALIYMIFLSQILFCKKQGYGMDPIQMFSNDLTLKNSREGWNE